jgi:MOSC domain-containing protein YiiM
VCSGLVAEILVSPTALTPPSSVAQARAIAGRGLDGDRYAAGIGTWSQYHDQSGSDLTLIESEVLEAIGMTGAQARRNLVTRGVRLNELVGKTFQIGATECRGVRLCEPCEALARNTGWPVGALLHGAGLRADILCDGTISVGDQIATIVGTSRPQ